MPVNDPWANNTLGAMKARIADEIARDDLTSQIANAISDAIAAYNNERFHFNESRNITFSTVNNQEFYTSSDCSDMPNFVKIDYMYLYIGGQAFRIDPVLPEEIEAVSVTSSTTGQPFQYCWYNSQIRLYPIPNAVWTVRIAAVLAAAAPASDGETGNPWMTTCELLIRSRAKYELAVHVLSDPDLAAAMGGSRNLDDDTLGGSVGEAMAGLRRQTKRITQIGGGGFVRPMNF